MNEDSFDCFVKNIEMDIENIFPFSPVHSSPRKFSHVFSTEDKRRRRFFPDCAAVSALCISTGAPWHLDDIKMKFVPSGERGRRGREDSRFSFWGTRQPASPSFHGSKRIETKTGRKRVWTALMGSVDDPGTVDDEKNEGQSWG